MKRFYSLAIFFAFLFVPDVTNHQPIKSFEGITINGISHPGSGATEYYEASFDYSLHPTILTW